MGSKWRKNKKGKGKKRGKGDSKYYTHRGVALSNNPLPTTMKAKFIYSQNFTMQSSGATPAPVVMSLNGLTQPTISPATGGHQPRGFDQLIGVLYDHYVVIGAKVRINFANNNTVTSSYCMAMIRDSAVTPIDMLDYYESANSKTCTVAPEGAGTPVKTIMMTCNPNRFLGRPSPLSDPQLKGSSLAGTAGNPSEQAYLHVAAVNTDLFSNGNVTAQITVEYTAILIEPIQPQLS